MSSKNHILPLSTLYKNFAVLMILMVLTITVALLPYKFPAMHEMSLLNNLIAIGIAITKAVLVILFFMNAKLSSQLTKFFVILGFVWLTIMFGTLLDYKTRSYEAVEGWEKFPENALSRKPKR